MMILVTGGSGSGKSAFAEDCVVSFGKTDRIYIATMYPFDEESRKRVQRHRKMRQGKGFETVECYTGLDKIRLPENCTVLLECMSNLVANEMFQEEGAYYTTLLWITGIDNVAFECSFTVPKGGSAKEAEEVIATLEARKEGEKYPAELIPVRLSEIYQINEGYEWVVSTVKQELKKDFQGVEEDLEKIQQVIDSGKISPKKKDEWLAIGITVCAILTNEVEGMEWKTLIDGNREVPVLEYQGRTIDPMKIAWSKVKAGQPCNIAEAYQSAIDHH